MEKIKTTAIISLSIIVVIIISIFFAWFFISKNAEKKQVKENKIAIEKINEQLALREQKIKELIDSPIIITKEKILQMDSSEMKHAIIDLQDKNVKLSDIIKQDTFLIESLKSDLQKTNDILAENFRPKHSISIFGLSGLDKTLDIDIYAGIIYRRYFFDGRFYIGGGAAVKAYKELGGSILIELGFTF